MEVMKTLNKDAFELLIAKPASGWARHAFDNSTKSDHVTSNMAESFNQWVGQLRGKPILTLVDMIRSKLMERMQLRFQQSMAWKWLVTPNVKKNLNFVLQMARNCQVIYAGGDEYSVVDFGIQFVVDLGTRNCTCGAWSIRGIPCPHAGAAIIHKRGNIEEYCDWYFTKEAFQQTYKEWIHPIPDETHWGYDDSEEVHPPPLKRLPGRPRKNRRKEGDEDIGPSQSRKSQTLRCFNCKEFGHNKRTCQRGPIKSKSSKNTRENQNAGVADRGRGVAGRGKGVAGRDATGRGVVGRGATGLGVGGRGVAGRGVTGRGVTGRGVAGVGRGAAGRGVGGRGVAGKGVGGRGVAGRGAAGRGVARSLFGGEGDVGN